MNTLSKIILGTALVLPGVKCAHSMDLRPDSLDIETTHVSHISQHFGSNATNFGYDSIALAASYKWRRLTVTVAEGIVLDSRDPHTHEACYGALFGPREVFTARFTFNLYRKQ